MILNFEKQFKESTFNKNPREIDKAAFKDTLSYLVLFIIHIKHSQFLVNATLGHDIHLPKKIPNKNKKIPFILLNY